MQINVNVDFQTIRNNTNVIINLILLKAKEIKMNVILVIPQPYFVDADCSFLSLSTLRYP